MAVAFASPVLVSQMCRSAFVIPALLRFTVNENNFSNVSTLQQDLKCLKVAQNEDLMCLTLVSRNPELFSVSTRLDLIDLS